MYMHKQVYVGVSCEQHHDHELICVSVDVCIYFYVRFMEYVHVGVCAFVVCLGLRRIRDHNMHIFPKIKTTQPNLRDGLSQNCCQITLFKLIHAFSREPTDQTSSIR